MSNEISKNGLEATLKSADTEEWVCCFTVLSVTDGRFFFIKWELLPMR